MSPEYITEGKFSVKSDVYSFGVILLEILCGKRNQGNNSLIAYVSANLLYIISSQNKIEGSTLTHIFTHNSCSRLGNCGRNRIFWSYFMKQ
jgi:serine/threonine protein kinase